MTEPHANDIAEGIPTKPVRRSPRQKLLIALPVVMLVSVVGLEGFLHAHYGLDSPVLMMSDRVTEYPAAVDVTKEWPGHAQFRTICEKHGIEPLELRHAYRAAFDAGLDPYRDYIHPNAIGQKAMADAIEPVLEAALRKSTTAPTTRNSPEPK